MRLLGIGLAAAGIVSLGLGWSNMANAQPKGPPGGRLPATGAPKTGGIQWFATWESGLREAQRSNRPILLVSAAPHCAGVSGIW